MQNNEEFDAILSNIRSALMRDHGEARTGAQIHRIILEAAPDIDIRTIVGIPAGPGALTKFIETYYSDIVKRIGMKGGDVLYGIGDGVVTQPEVGEANIWKVFVSPGAMKNLFIRTSDMRLIVADDLVLDHGTHHIPRVTNDEHDRIRQDFRTSLNEDQRERLDEIVEQDSSYDEFIVALRSVGLSRMWGIFRRNAYKELLVERLEPLLIEGELISRVTEQLMASQRSLLRRESGKPSSTTPAPPSVTNHSQALVNSGASDSLEAARSLARSVINNMGYDEIRVIHVPLGAVLDVLNSKN